MPVADLYNVPTNEQELHWWSFNHMAHHRAEVDALNDANPGLDLPLFVLDPMDPDNAGVFLYQHQELHNNTGALTGVSGYDLTSVDLRDPQQLAGWVFLNATLHYEEAQILGVW